MTVAIENTNVSGKPDQNKATTELLGDEDMLERSASEAHGVIVQKNEKNQIEKEMKNIDETRVKMKMRCFLRTLLTITVRCSG